MTVERRALWAVATAVLLWGSSGIAIKWVSPSGIVTAFYRLWFAIPLLWLLPLLRPGLRGKFDRHWLKACAVGGTLFYLHQILFFSSLKLTTVANVTVIGALQPAVVLSVAGPMFGEHSSTRAKLWTALAFAGTSLMVLGASSAASWSPTGDLMACMNLFAFSAYFLASKRIRTRVGSWEYVIGMTTVAGLWMLATAIALGEPLSSPQGYDWAVLLAIAVFPGTLGHVLVNWAHAHTRALSVSIMLLAVPLLASFGAWMLLGESLSSLQLTGGFIALGAISAVVASAPASHSEELAESAAATDAP